MPMVKDEFGNVTDVYEKTRFSLPAPRITLAQAMVLDRIRAAGEDYDGSYVVGGPKRQREAKRLPETGWLIEFSQRVFTTPTYYGKTDDGLGQTTDHQKAIRFVRKEDAEAVIEDIGWTEASAIEHQWG